MKLQISEIVKYAWKTLWDNSASWALIMALFVLLNVVQGVFGYVPAENVQVTESDWVAYQEGSITEDDLLVKDVMYSLESFSGEGTNTETNEYPVSEASGSWLVDLVATILSFILGVGIIVTSIAHARGEKRGLFESIQEQEFITYLKYFGGSIVVAILVLLGLLLLIVPGIIIAMVLSFALYAIVDQKVGVFESLSMSNKMTTGYKWQLFGMVFVTIGINILGALALLIGLLVSVPLTYLIWARTYDLLLQNMNGVDGSVPEGKTEEGKDDSEEVIEVEEVEEGDTTEK